ncbi:MAG: hypothetical protein LAT81_00605 [Oceanicaulis sp.]|nr:hypothetical protein [Oceanicaulis sp.]
MKTAAKSFVFGAASALFLASAAYASPAGQVFEITAGETSYSLWFDEDGGYIKQTEDGAKVGAYTFEDGELCLTSAETEEARCGEWPADLAVNESAVSTDWSDDGLEATILRVE